MVRFQGLSSESVALFEHRNGALTGFNLPVGVYETSSHSQPTDLLTDQLNNLQNTK